MEFCQRLTGRGGWPLTVVLMPDGLPVFAATYLPKTPRPGYAGLIGLLDQVAEQARTHEARLREVGQQLLASMQPGLPRITSYNVCYTKLLRTPYMSLVPDSLDEVARDALMKRLALDYMKEDPARTARVMLKKFHRFWNPWPNAEGYDKGLYKLAAVASFGPVLLLSLAGLWVLRDRWREWGVIWLFVGYLTALHMVAMGSIRYRLPLEPLLIACAAACAA